MASHRIDRTTEDIKRELTAILRELKDPRVQETMLSVVRVEVTNDLSYCKVYVSSMEGMDHAKTGGRGTKNPPPALSAGIGRENPYPSCAVAAVSGDGFD